MVTRDLFAPHPKPPQPGRPIAAEQLRALADEFDAQAAATPQLTTQTVLRNCAEQARHRADQLESR